MKRPKKRRKVIGEGYLVDYSQEYFKDEGMEHKVAFALHKEPYAKRRYRLVLEAM